MVGKAIRDGTTSVGVGTTAMGFCVEESDWALGTTRRVGVAN